MRTMHIAHELSLPVCWLCVPTGARITANDLYGVHTGQKWQGLGAAVLSCGHLHDMERKAVPALHAAYAIAPRLMAGCMMARHVFNRHRQMLDALAIHHR